MPKFTLSLAELQGPEQVVPALKILLLLTILSIAPAILVSMTAFTRIVIVLSFLRQALGSQNVPPMQVIMALSLLLTGVVMAPVAHKLDVEAFTPYTQKQIDEKQAFERAAHVARGFLVPQTREADLRLFYELNQTALPATQEDVALHLLVPAFMISELRTAFEMGFLLFLPFVLIDLIVASILTAMGMVMLPPTMLATPLKLLLFVVVDGWSLMSRSLVASFS
jgi:flagellar biosynthetic protein FliP